MKNLMYTAYMFVLGIIALATREIVTFIMLGVILVCLNNIHSTLKEILEVNKQKNN